MKPEWLFTGAGPMHYVFSRGRVTQTACGIVVDKTKLYEGHSTQKCEQCLKAERK